MIIGPIQNIFNGIMEFFSIKLIPSIVIPIFAVFFGVDGNQIFLALFILVCFDFVTGVFASHVSGQEIKSKTAVRSAFKLAVYGLLISSGHLTEQITVGYTFIEEAVTSFLALTEFISILENIGKMGFVVPQKLLNQLTILRDSGPEDKNISKKDSSVQ